jgi:hypothetical protein
VPKRKLTDVGGKQQVQCTYQANTTFINSSNLGSIGYTLTLTPSDGGQVASLVVAIPWAGDNTIWVGQGESDPERTYHAHSGVNGQVSQVATFGNYKVTLTINKLSGKTEDSYFYASMVVLEPVA